MVLCQALQLSIILCTSPGLNSLAFEVYSVVSRIVYVFKTCYLFSNTTMQGEGVGS